MMEDVATRRPEGPPDGTILCTNRHTIPSQSFRRIEFSVLLVAGTIGDYKAYWGEGSDEFIAAHGSALSYEEACLYFPGRLERELYRR